MKSFLLTIFPSTIYYCFGQRFTIWNPVYSEKAQNWEAYAVFPCQQRQMGLLYFILALSWSRWVKPCHAHSCFWSKCSTHDFPLPSYESPAQTWDQSERLFAVCTFFLHWISICNQNKMKIQPMLNTSHNKHTYHVLFITKGHGKFWKLGQERSDETLVSLTNYTVCALTHCHISTF